MSDIIVYSSSYCPFCRRAKSLLDAKGATYREINIELDDEARETMMERSGRRTVPQIFVDGEHLGDCEEIYAMDSRGELDARLGLD